ncbi:hypothetical protein DMENIID0001_108830 [Sergentomyia squamirostris]
MKSSLCADKEEAILYFSAFSVLIVGGSLNLALLLGIFKRVKLRGTYCFVLQLVVCDLIVLSVFPIKQWIEGVESFCEVVYGLDILAGTATTYVILAVNFHAVSTHNLAVCHHLRELQRRHEHSSNVHDDCENRENNENNDLAGNDDETLKVRRTLTIDYNRMKRSISAILPTVTIWLLATSMALPHVLSLHTPKDITINSCCSLQRHITHLQSLPFIVMIVFQLAIPSLGFIGTGLIVSSKLMTFQLDLKKCKLAENVKEILMLSLILTLSFLFITLHHHLLAFLDFTPTSTHALILTIANNLMPTIRPFIYLTTLKHLRRATAKLFNIN